MKGVPVRQSHSKATRGRQTPIIKSWTQTKGQIQEHKPLFSSSSLVNFKSDTCKSVLSEEHNEHTWFTTCPISHA